jgi:integrase
MRVAWGCGGGFPASCANAAGPLADRRRCGGLYQLRVWSNSKAGLRVSELTALRWDQVDLKGGLLHVNRLKQGTPSVHPLRGPEIRALRRLERESPASPYVFPSERGGQVPTAIADGELSALAFPVHPHMLRHGCGYKLANDGQDTRAIEAPPEAPSSQRTGSKASGTTEVYPNVG